jgi:hypothetical protein
VISSPPLPPLWLSPLFPLSLLFWLPPEPPYWLPLGLPLVWLPLPWPPRCIEGSMSAPPVAWPRFTDVGSCAALFIS